MLKRSIAWIGTGLLVLVILLYQIPAINNRIAWGYEVAKTYARNIINPVGNVPTVVQNSTSTEASGVATLLQIATYAIAETAIPATSTPVPIPAQARLNSPPYEKQTPNNCGPAALSMMLHMFGWNGSQKDISDDIKPVNGDRNVNPEELAYWVRNYAGWLRIEYRVGVESETLKHLIAAGYPVIIEGTTFLDPDDSGWPDDDLWAAHYLLLTGYDNSTQMFIAQDTYRGPDRKISYEQLNTDWKPFNFLYLVVYLPEQEEQIKSLLASDWDLDQNRQKALEIAKDAITADPSDAFAWFNLGSNLVYFERYDEANAAHDKARELGLPQRMFRYQFGPFIANFQTNRIDDLLALTEYALQRTELSEEAWLWHGWALYRKGDIPGAIAELAQSAFYPARI